MLHGKVIDYEDIKNLPSRNAFLSKDIFDETSENISKKSPLFFMPNDLHEMALQDKKYDKAEYKIVLFGTLIDGRNATVVISGIKNYFEVVLPAENSNEIALELYNNLKNTKYSEPDSFELIKGRQFIYYQKTKTTFARFYFNKLKLRKEAIKIVRAKGFETTTDDSSCYYRVVCRDNLSTFSSWVEISDYKLRSYDGIRGVVYEVNISNYNKYQGDIISDVNLAKDNTMSMGWDIETYSPDGQLPVPENPEHNIFMISLVFQWYHSNAQLLKVCLIDHPCNPHPDFLVIVCENEKKLIKAFAKIVHKMKPEFNIGFNDSEYDWNWIITRGKSYPGVLTFMAECFDRTSPWNNYDDENIMKYNFKRERVKLEADAYAEGSTLCFPGYINIDVRTVFRQLYPTAEQSNLNFFLACEKLSGKKDMPYQDMFGYYREINAMMKNSAGISGNNKFEMLKNKMTEIAEYCVIDALRCHELMKIRSVIMDRREVANLSYTSVFDAFYRANGMKVRNLVIARGQKFDIRFSNINNDIMEEGKFPGAHVVPPKKGLITSKLTMKERCDISTVNIKYSEWIEVTPAELGEFKNIIIAHGSHLDDAKIKKLIESYSDSSSKPPLRKCFIDFIKEKNGRPIPGLDFSSLYPSLIMAYNFSPEFIIKDQKSAKEIHAAGAALHKIKFMYNSRTIKGWSIRHDNIFDPTDPKYKFGVYPMILKELFDSRTSMKSGLHKWESEKERLESIPREKFVEPEIQAEYDNVCFNFNYLDSKQRALKVFMNTFYGESGNKLSPFFTLELAGAITSSGQDNIKFVQRYVESLGCEVMYGDTDSLYLSMPERCFDELDKQYYSGAISKDIYWSEMVNITFKEVAIITKAVNDMLIADNGTKFLKMAYEEALFPVAFLAKKKYYGIPHISVPNFNPKNLFIRGLEVKKRGVSEFLRKICMNIMWDSVSLTNYSTLMELVQNKIDYIYKTDWDFKDFVMTDVFKPNKQNIKVQTFAARMAAEGITVKPYNRFDYVIVKRNPYKYDVRGRKQDLSIGEKMEYYEYAVEKKMEIDIDYYMQGSINGQLARLITYAETFHVNPTSNEDSDLKIADDKTYNNACKFIENYCEKYYTNYNSKGKIYQKIFRMANSVVTERIKQYLGNETVSILNSNYDMENLEAWLEDKAEKEALKNVKGYGKIHVMKLVKDMNEDDKGKKMQELQHIYFGRKSTNISIMREKAFKERQAMLKRQLSDNLSKLINIFAQHSKIVNNVQQKIKNILDINNLYNSADEIVPDLDNLNNSKKIDISELENTADKELNSLVNNESSRESLNRLRYIYININSNYDFIHKTRSIIDYLKLCRNNNVGFVNPKEFNVKKHIKSQVDDIINEFNNMK